MHRKNHTASFGYRSAGVGHRNTSDQMQRNVPEYFNLPDPLRTLLQIYLSPPAIVCGVSAAAVIPQQK